MYRCYITIIIIFAIILSVSAQSENDSIRSLQLDEVLVKAYNRVQHGDTLIVIPTTNQRTFNVTGFELLRSMMLPELRVNTISPGWVNTNMTVKLEETNNLDEINQNHILGIGKPEDVSGVVLFMLSDRGKWITGTDIVVDGGYLT